MAPQADADIAKYHANGDGGFVVRAVNARCQPSRCVDCFPNLPIDQSRAGKCITDKNGKLQSTGRLVVSLHFRCNMPDTEYARDLMALITRGDVRECSFGFIAKADRWNRARDRRELLDVNLMDTSVVTFPAYPATAVAARSVEIHGEKREIGWYRSAVLTPNDIPYRGNVTDEEQRLRDYLRLAKIRLEIM